MFLDPKSDFDADSYINSIFNSEKVGFKHLALPIKISTSVPNVNKFPAWKHLYGLSTILVG